MAKNMNKTSYIKIFGIAGICAVFAIAILSVTPVAHAANYGYGGGTYTNNGGNHNNGNQGGNNYGGGNNNYGGTYINNGGNHNNGNQGGYYGGNNNYGGTYINGNHDQPHNPPPQNPPHNPPPQNQDHNDYHPTDHNYGGTYGYNYSSNSTPTVIYQPVQTYYEPSQTYYDYEQTPVYYQQPTQTYYQPEQTYYQPQVAVNYQTQQYPQYQVINQTTNGLNISCSVDSSSVTINQPVTWTATVTGGAAPYTYSWSGSDGLSGSQASIIKYYGSSGYKVATVSVTSADGSTNTHTCENAATVRNPGSRNYIQRENTPVTQPATTTNPNAAAAGLINIPWGWIAFLIILVLAITIAYLLFTETKKV
jgi:hypothetical protein